MKLHVLNSGSKANGYVLQNDKEALLIECGCPIENALRAVDFVTAKIVGCLVSHEHGDHARFIERYLEYMPVFCSQGTNDSINYKHKRRAKILRQFETIQLGGFRVQTFDTQHDSEEPFGFVIEHEESGKIVFATDTYYLKYRFDNLSNIMIECNYDSKILAENTDKGLLPLAVRERTTRSHMSLETCIKTLQANDIRKVSNVVLLHLSNQNADAEMFKQRVEQAIGKRVIIARKNVKFEINKTI